MVLFSMRDSAKTRVERARQRRFERLVTRALDDLPPAIAHMLDNVEVVIEDEPTPEQIGQRDDPPGTLFGLYEGVPLLARGAGYSLVLPDKITIFRGPLERTFVASSVIAEQVRITVIHELGHHLGFEEERLHDLGLA